MTLVIAEKPSVAGELSKVLGAAKKENGYFSGQGYYVSWCIGHLISLAEPEEYDPDLKQWSLASLPILPEKFQTSISEKTAAQFHILRGLMSSNEVTDLVCATDAAREGELIFRLVYEKAGCKKPVKRLWISSIEESAIRDGFANLKDSSVYDNLYHAAQCRQQADWLVGMNFTRLYTKLYGKLLPVGRVQTPTVNLIVKRQEEIVNFIPREYYSMMLDLGSFKAYAQLETKALADSCLLEKSRGSNAVVISAEKKEKKENPEPLYDLTSLQRDANRLLGYSAQQTLDTLQGLYEAKLTTYPRTDSRYITPDMEASTAKLVEKLIAEGIPSPSLSGMYDINRINVGLVINGQKVTDHHAIIPTVSISADRMSSLSDMDRNILTLIIYRLLAAVYTPFRYMSTSVVLDVAGTKFNASGREILESGFKSIQEHLKTSLLLTSEKEDKAPEQSLPALTQGDVLQIIALTATAKKTKPPKPYTEDTLLLAMETAGKTITDEVLKDTIKDSGLGTPATRAGIIENIIKIGYIERKQNQLLPTPTALIFMGLVSDRLKEAELTAQWEMKLDEIGQGSRSADSFMTEIKSYVDTLVTENKAKEVVESPFPDAQSIGICPICGDNVVEYTKSFSCHSGKDGCGFVIWKTTSGKGIFKEQAKRLLKNGKTELIRGFSNKSGKSFNAYLTLDKDNNVVFEFDAKGNNRRR